MESMCKIKLVKVSASLIVKVFGMKYVNILTIPTVDKSNLIKMSNYMNGQFTERNAIID